MWTQNRENRPILIRKTTAPAQDRQANAVTEVAEIHA
jgi:hypothetical protein